MRASDTTPTRRPVGPITRPHGQIHWEGFERRAHGTSPSRPMGPPQVTTLTPHGTPPNTQVAMMSIQLACLLCCATAGDPNLALHAAPPLLLLIPMRIWQRHAKRAF